MAIKDKGHKKVEDLAKKLETLVIEYVPVGDIRPNAWNPNRQSDHDFDLLKKSMGEDGITQPVILKRGDNVIVDGEHRWRAAQELGYDKIPVVYVDMSPEQMRIATLRHNRARGSEDIELTAQLLRDLRELDALGWAQESLIMDDIELQRLIEDVAAPDALAAEQFSQAWVPQGAHHADEESQGDTGRTIGGAPAIEGITPAAAERQKFGEKRLAEAKTEEERVSAMRDRDIHRVALTFSGEEAKIVREALGDNPAVKLLELCRTEIERVANG